MASRFRGAAAARWRTSPRWTRASLTAGAAALLVLSGLLTGSATLAHTGASPRDLRSALSVPPPASFAAPYTGQGDSVFEGSELGCVATSVPVFPFSNATTGKLTASVSTKVSACGSVLGWSAQAAGFAIYIDPFAGKTGTDRIVVHFTSTFNVTFNVTGSRGVGAPPSSANFSIVWEAAVYNESDQVTSAGFTSYEPTLTDQISSGTYSHLFKGVKETGYCNASLSSGYTYEVAIGVEFELITSVGTSGATASASLNAATDGNALKVASISEP